MIINCNTQHLKHSTIVDVIVSFNYEMSLPFVGELSTSQLLMFLTLNVDKCIYLFPV